MEGEPNASSVRLVFLERLYHAWEQRPGPNDYFDGTDITSLVRRSFESEPDDRLLIGSAESLIQDGLIEAVGTPSGEAALRISTEGRKTYLALLTADLEALLNAAQNDDVDHAGGNTIAKLQSSVAEARNGSRKSALDKLMTVANWVIETSTTIGTNVASSALKLYIGLPP